jgi:hypothetical protein
VYRKPAHDRSFSHVHGTVAPVFRGALVLVIAILLAVCQSTDPDFTDGAANRISRRRPVWLDSYPTEPGYYVGVGSAKTGDQGADMATARTRALVDLVSSISTQIQSEVLVSAGEDSAGNAFEEALHTIRETVDQHVREVEIADHYYTEADGYWVYVRLDKAIWASIQTEEMDQLARRIVSLVEPEFEGDRATLAARLGTLWKAWTLLMESPYAGVLEAGLLGESGVLIDIVERRIAGYIDALSIDFEPRVLQTLPGRPAMIELEVRTNLALRTGTMNVVLADHNAGHSVDVVTDEDGRYSGELVLPEIDLGSHRFAVAIDFSRFGVDPADMRQRIILPESEFLLEVSLFNASLAVSMDDDSGLPTLQGSIASLLSAKMPLQFGAASEAEYDVRVHVQSRSAPPNEFDITIVFTKAVFTVSKDGSALVTYETHEAKDGGITLFQAQTRSFAKLISELAEVSDLEGSLESAFSME